MSTWVRAEDVIRIFKAYIEEYDGEVTHTDQLMEELQDAITDSVHLDIDGYIST